MMALQTRGRNRNASAMKLVSALRGKGVLTSPRGEVPVRYGIDVFDEGGRRTARGWIVGAAAFSEMTTAGLRLADGVQLEVTIEDGDAEGASVEVTNPDALAAASSSPLAVRARTTA